MLPPPVSVLDDGLAPFAEVTRVPEPEVPEDDLLKMYRLIELTRFLDQRLMNLQRQGRISFYLTCTGEEAAGLGPVYALRKSDWLYPCYREHAAVIWKGFSLEAFINQFIGNSADYCKGRQMPSHFADRSCNLTSISSPVGTQITQAMGSAWAAKIQKHDTAVMVFFGDGSTSQGDFHVALNFAALYKVPVVFVCRNNGYAISTRFDQQTASGSIAVKGAAYGIRTVQADGNDLPAMIHAGREAVETARGGGGPTLIEAVTYRIGAHSSSDDPSQYRSADEVKQWERRDPLLRYRRHLENRGILKPGDIERIREDVRQEVNRAIASAEKAPPPALSTMFDDVYAQPPLHLQEQRGDCMQHGKS